ncbi:MAG: nitrilase family protein [Pseudomonadota bacterium]
MAMPEAEITVACIQFEPRIGNRAHNVAESVGALEKAAAAGASLAVLPELSDSGYVFETREEAFSLASEPGASDSIEAWAEIARARDLHVVAGFAEREGPSLYNSAVVIAPDGVLGVYRKTHLWGAEALFFERGDLGYPVFRTRLGRIGALICYDGWFPEAWRLLALQGADIVCVPTNWVPMPNQPEEHLSMSNILCMAAAHSNSMYVAAACRTGVERGQPFIGQSVIVSNEGWPVAGPAPKEGDALLTARVNLAAARRGRQLNDFNQLLRDRRADLYGDALGSSIDPGWH